MSHPLRRRVLTATIEEHLRYKARVLLRQRLIALGQLHLLREDGR